MATERLVVHPSSVTWRLGIVAGLLAAISLALQMVKYLTGHGYLYGLVALMDVDGEQNVPAIYSVFLLLSAAGLLAFIAHLARRTGAGDVFKWLVLCGGFGFMAMDEAWLIHERLINPVRRMLGGNPEQLGMFHFAWVVPALGLVAVLGFYFLGFLWRLPLQFRIRFIVAGALYVGGAVGIELLGGAYSEGHGEDNLTYKILTTIEESLEMAGVIAFIDALLRYLSTTHKHVTTRFKENPADITVFDRREGDEPQHQATQFRHPPASASPTRSSPAAASHTIMRPRPNVNREPPSDQTIIRPPPPLPPKKPAGSAKRQP